MSIPTSGFGRPHNNLPEADPSGKAQHEPGAKLDHGKAPVFQGVMMYFPRALLEVAKVSGAGAEIYTWNGWRSVVDGVVRYSNARERHILKEQIEGPFDLDPKIAKYRLRHKAQVIWNAMAALELELEAEESAVPTIRGTGAVSGAVYLSSLGIDPKTVN